MSADGLTVTIRAISGLQDWTFDQSGIRGYRIDSIDGVNIGNNADLLEKVSAIIA